MILSSIVIKDENARRFVIATLCTYSMFAADTPSPPLITATLRAPQNPVNKSINHRAFSSAALVKFMVLSFTKSQRMSAQARLEG